jgi:putative peptide zinc metalloprotease protein
MADALFSASWYRVAELKPRLRRHTQLHRQDYRGQVWYVLQDHAGGKSHRFRPAAWRLIGLMDGQRTVQQLWDAASQGAGDEVPTQDEVIRLLGHLHAADALICDVQPNSEELFRRFRRNERQQLKQRLWTPLAIRVPLFDPEQFLERSYPAVRFLFSWFGVLLWLGVVGAGAVLAAAHWSELTDNLVDRALTPTNLLLLWFVYPTVKALHELGHGYAAKFSGGEVHEIGIMFLVLVPVPYVDVSSAWGFRDKRQRMLVGAAGIIVELFLGALAMFVWVNVEPGTVHALAYNVMLISGISTLLFNGNPLLKFDGYYVLADALEIPNLGTRSNRYLGYLLQRYVYGARDVESPAHTPDERGWLALYGIAAFCYRMFIMFVIILYIGGKFFAVGVLLAAWALITQVAMPVVKNMSMLFNSPKLRRNRTRSLATSAALLLGIGALLFLMPAPFWTRAEGITWPVEQTHVRAAADGFIGEVLATPGNAVRAGQPLVKMYDDFSDARLAILTARQDELRSQLMQARVIDRVQMSIIREELTTVTADLERARERSRDLTVVSQRDGTFVIPHAGDLPGRFLRKGERIGFVLQADDPVHVHVVVPHDTINMIHDTTRGISIMPGGWDDAAFPAQLLREVPGGTMRLPNAALGSMGGGAIAVDPREPDGRTTLERVFELELELPQQVPGDYLGRRVHVRFDHGYKPLGLQLYRSLRQLLLRRFSV